MRRTVAFERIASEPEVLDRDMTPADIAAALQRLRFGYNRRQLAVRATLWRMEIEILREIHRYRFAKRGRRFGSDLELMIVYGAGNLRQIKLITPCLHYGTGHASHSHMHRRFARALFRRRAGAGAILGQ